MHVVPIRYILQELWRWFADTGIDLALLILLAFLVPRMGRFAHRIAERQVEKSADPEEGKGQLAIVGVAIYIA